LNKTYVSVAKTQPNLDKEWTMLILQAKQIGLSASEVRHFLTSNQLDTITTNPQHD
jgi:hypothetical protein